MQVDVWAKFGYATVIGVCRQLEDLRGSVSGLARQDGDSSCPPQVHCLHAEGTWHAPPKNWSRFDVTLGKRQAEWLAT